MGSRIECFMLERQDRARRSLRRYTSLSDLTPDACPHAPGKYSYHNASVVVAESEPFDSPYEGDGTGSVDMADPRYPTACACGYVFLPGDRWQVNLDRLYRDPRDGKLYTGHDAPAGAMWYADWMSSWAGPDGKCLVVKLPDGTDWVVDGPANNAPGKIPGWDRTGVPPLVTATPSIQSPRYHGFLTAGFLEEC